MDFILTRSVRQGIIISVHREETEAQLFCLKGIWSLAVTTFQSKSSMFKSRILSAKLLFPGKHSQKNREQDIKGLLSFFWTVQILPTKVRRNTLHGSNEFPAFRCNLTRNWVYGRLLWKQEGKLGRIRWDFRKSICQIAQCFTSEEGDREIMIIQPPSPPCTLFPSLQD